MAFDTGPIATENPFPWQTLMACLDQRPSGESRPRLAVSPVVGPEGHTSDAHVHNPWHRAHFCRNRPLLCRHGTTSDAVPPAPPHAASIVHWPLTFWNEAHRNETAVRLGGGWAGRLGRPNRRAVVRPAGIGRPRPPPRILAENSADTAGRRSGRPNRPAELPAHSDTPPTPCAS